MQKKRLWQVICVVSVIGFFGCGAYLLENELELIKAVRHYEELRELVKEGNLQTDLYDCDAEMRARKYEESIEAVKLVWPLASTVNAAEESNIALEKNTAMEENTTLEASAALMADSTETDTESRIDFELLNEINTDIYAWIEMPGMEVDYPILQNAEDDLFYLSHTYDKSESESGAIYSESYNAKDFSDFHTVLYGHDMRNNTMFGSLLQLEDGGMMRRNNRILIYHPEKTLEYQVFAAYVFDSKHLLLNYDFTQMQDREEYLKEIVGACEGKGAFDQELFETVDADSHILTLSTCYHGDARKRFLVQAVLLEDGQSEAQIGE